MRRPPVPRLSARLAAASTVVATLCMLGVPALAAALPASPASETQPTTGAVATGDAAAPLARTPVAERRFRAQPAAEAGGVMARAQRLEVERATVEAPRVDGERATAEAEGLDAERAATESQRAATESQRAATEAERAATEAERAATAAERAATESQRAATESQRAAAESERAARAQRLQGETAAAADRAPGWEQRVGKLALTRIAYPWQQLGWTVQFLPARTGYRGMAWPADRRIDVFVRDGQSLDEVAYVIAHELGHAVDLTHGTDERRTAWRQLRGMPAGAGWWACDACTDYATGAGDFAEVFAVSQLGPVDYRSEMGPPPDAATLTALAPLFGP
jgi:hypothetical protein